MELQKLEKDRTVGSKTVKSIVHKGSLGHNEDYVAKHVLIFLFEFSKGNAEIWDVVPVARLEAFRAIKFVGHIGRF